MSKRCWSCCNTLPSKMFEKKSKCCISCSFQKESNPSRYNKFSKKTEKGRLIAEFNAFLRGKNKSFKWASYSQQELIQHLESLFYNHPINHEKMSWENYGKDGWVVDHKLPRTLFDIQNSEQMKACWSLKNLQPLWEEENAAKSDKYDKTKLIVVDNLIIYPK